MTRPPFHRIQEILSTLLKDSVPRSPSEPLHFMGEVRSARLETPDERAVAAIGSLLVCEIVRHGGSLLPVGPARKAVERLLESFPESDRPRLESEAAEMMLWLEDALSLLGDGWQELDDQGLYPWDDREYPDDGKAARIRKAIEDRSDLEIEYFTYSRNALTKRHVTPIEIEGERILLALCHWRRDDRRFLLRRIKAIRGLGPKPRRTGPQLHPDS